jgi:endo-1,3-1,4-beta-glycanase ExoK
MPDSARIVSNLSFSAKIRAEISRFARMSPERAVVVSGLVVAVALALAMAGMGGYREALADEAHSIAANTPVEAKAAEVPAMAAPEPAAATPPPRALSQIGNAFIERFEGRALDENRWYVSDGWSNGDWMENDWRRSQVTVTPEGMRLTLARGPEGSDKPFASGEVSTRETFRYGYFEVRMRVPRDPGLITGAFTYAPRDENAGPNEIDIEILGRSTRRVELTIHENGRATSETIHLPFDSADGFHTFGFDWRSDAVRWYADGVMIHELAGPAVARLTRPQKIMLTQWASAQLHEWVGEFDPTRGPWKLDIACVAYAPTYEGPICG